MYLLIIKLGLLDGWNPSVCTGKEPEVLIMYHLLQSFSRTSAFRLECLVWPARFSHIYPCNCLGILLYFCVLEISVWFVHVFPLNFSHFMANLSRAWKMPALSVFMFSVGKTMFLLVLKIPKWMAYFIRLWMSSWKELCLPKLSWGSRILWQKKKNSTRQLRPLRQC